jgi:hypothetical protein
MTASDRDFDRIASAWLDLMPDEAPDRVIDAVLQAVETTPQVRRPIARPWRSTPMTRFALIAAAAALGIAMLGGALYVGGLGDTPPPVPTPVPAAPTPEAIVTFDESPDAVSEGIRATWVAPMPAGDELATLGLDGDTLRLVIGTDGTTAWLEGASARQVLPGRLDSTGLGDLDVQLELNAAGCRSGDVGRYRFDLGATQETLMLTATDDPCDARREALARTWTRSLVGTSYVPSGVVDIFDPAFHVTLADGFYAGRPMRDAIELTRGDNTFTFLAFRNPQAFAGPCETERQPWQPGARAFVDALKAHPALTNFAEEAVEIGGYPAIRVTYDARTDLEPCPPDAHPFYLWAPRDDPNASWWLSAGDPDLLYMVDHPDGTLMFQVLPIGDPGTDAVMESIEFVEPAASTTP